MQETFFTGIDSNFHSNTIVHNLCTVVPATTLPVCFVCLKESTCETRKNAFYFTSNALLILEIIKF